MKCFLEDKSEAFVTLLRGCSNDTSLFLSLSLRVYHQNLYQNDFNMTASSFSEGGKGGEEGKEEEERDVMSRAEFVSNLIKAMEMSKKRNEEEEEENDNDSKTRAKKCARKMRFDYPQVTRKELERLSETLDKDGTDLVFDSKVLENIALGATKADDANSNTNSSIDGVGSKDAHRKLAIQVFAEFPLRMMGDDETAALVYEWSLESFTTNGARRRRMHEPPNTRSNIHECQVGCGIIESAINALREEFKFKFAIGQCRVD